MLLHEIKVDINDKDKYMKDYLLLLAMIAER